jgi:hypothetical protein
MLICLFARILGFSMTFQSGAPSLIAIFERILSMKKTTTKKAKTASKAKKPVKKTAAKASKKAVMMKSKKVAPKKSAAKKSAKKTAPKKSATKKAAKTPEDWGMTETRDAHHNAILAESAEYNRSHGREPKRHATRRKSAKVGDNSAKPLDIPIRQPQLHTEK